MKIVDEKLFVYLIKNSLKSREVVRLMNYTVIKGKDKNVILSLIQDMKGSFMFGNNNCPMKILDIKMGPIKPGKKVEPKKKVLKALDSGMAGMEDEEGNQKDDGLSPLEKLLNKNANAAETAATIALLKNARTIRTKGFNSLPEHQRIRIKMLLGNNAGMFPFMGRTSRLPIEMWFLAEKCLVNNTKEVANF